MSWQVRNHSSIDDITEICDTGRHTGCVQDLSPLGCDTLLLGAQYSVFHTITVPPSSGSNSSRRTAAWEKGV